MTRTKVAIVFGGCSEEHPVSVKSARQVASAIDAERYVVRFVGITPAGAWLACDGPDDGWEQRGRPALISPDRTVHGLLVDGGDGFVPERIDVVLPVLHGRFGEDGALQGLLELAGIPYVGCDVQSSALCMDKSVAYSVVRGAGIATPSFRTIDADRGLDVGSLTFPVFVKPARSGSSFGVTKVTGADELSGAIEEARRFDSKVLVEEAVGGSEIGCAVLGHGADLVVGELDRISLSHGLFRIHQEDDPEHGSENSTIEVPADITPEERDRVRATAVAIYRALGCRGLARVDMFLTDSREVVLNEVNTLPGLTSYSRYPRMMAAAGWSLSDVIDRLVRRALEQVAPEQAAR